MHIFKVIEQFYINTKYVDKCALSFGLDESLENSAAWFRSVLSCNILRIRNGPVHIFWPENRFTPAMMSNVMVVPPISFALEPGYIGSH